MAGEPSTHDPLERMTRDMTHQEALAQSRRRLTSTANNRIQLTKPKMTPPNDTRHTNMAHHDPAILGRKETNNALNLIDRSLENMPPVKRRTVQIKEILAPQEPADIIGHNNNIVGNESYGYNRMENSRKRLAVDTDNYAHFKESRIHDPVNVSTSNDSSWELRQCQEELREAREQLQSYKEQLAEKTIQYEEVLNVRISEPEKALEDFQHWTQNTEEGYLELRNQFEIVWNKSKEMDLTLEGDSKQKQQQDETTKLRDLVHQLTTELEQKNAELNEQNKVSTEDAQHLLSLYTDLTGLVVRDTKTKKGVTSYKCLITGKNGALQFALSIGRGSNAYVFYSPALDRHRDSKLISKFPAFLKEDIEFTKDNLHSFFTTLSQLMNK
ncbi:conserved hypothetical protein [Mucor ambiguus]|uniref:Monopolin complex subunit Csm1/Pcs1 C-terminal domain-containing protein n=1 Tax=Mucor ambiguus TaxID=91626 RepID=A0A0C9M490_9FUNG|nr:conserved hypothetical protein [Mucor ambiguus]